MKIESPPSPTFRAKLTHKLSTKISKEFRYEILVDKAKENIDSIIVLGNGDVDDLTIPIVCHHLNGNKIVGITKPERKRKATLNDFPTYLSKLKIRKIALVMDQEDEDLNEIFEKIEHGLRNQHIRFNEAKSEDRFKQYKCEFASRTFDFILIVNGMEEISTATHKIEDHLVKGALEFSIVEDLDIQDSKETWKSFDESLQREILNKFKGDKSRSSNVFSQHFKGLQLLKES